MDPEQLAEYAGGRVGERLGPYRVTGKLGAGGMGEVYRGHDERLERDVALKLIRLDGKVGADRVARFRREARMAASLNHPAIVQVFDVFDSESGEVLVMELVDGRSLRDHLEANDLSPDALLAIAADVAGGLAHAHAKGIVHRDLKTENVVVTAAGRGKILDFGLARRVVLAPGSETLSADGTVVGTFRTMSPEQACGRPIDHRSDLFSLGVLLYECLVGSSPFLAGTPEETLLRIVNTAHVPAREAAPNVPEHVAALVDRLLDKDPSRRPDNAALVERALRSLLPGPLQATNDGATPDRFAETAVEPQRKESPPRRRRRVSVILAVVALAVAGGAAPVAYHALRPGAAPAYVAMVVPAPQGEVTKTTKFTQLALREAVLRTLASLDGISPLPVEGDTPASPAAAVAQATAAQEVVTATLDCAGDECRVELTRSSADGVVVWTQGFHVPLEKPLVLAEAVEGHLRHAFPERGVRPGQVPLEVDPADYADYIELRRAYEQKDSGAASTAELLSRLALIRERSPRFVEAYVYAAGLLRLRYRQQRDAADLREAATLLARARELAPRDPRPLVRSFEVALAREDVKAAEAWLGALEKIDPGGAEVLTSRASLEERQGHKHEALELMEAAVRQHPSTQVLFRAASMAYRAGDADRARRHLTAALTRNPASSACRSLLAQVELLHGSLERAAELYAGLVAAAPEVTELGNLGVAEMLRGRYPEAEKAFARALEAQPSQVSVALNLADSRALQGRSADAASLYRRVLELTESVSTAAGSPDWLLLSARAQALAHLGRTHEAAAAVQQVLVMAHENAQARYEAALTYALIDERASAIVNATEALKRGVGPRWFMLGFFDRLRSAPELRALLESPARP